MPTRCRTNDGTQRFVVVPIAQSGSPQGQYQYAPNQTYPRNQNKANATAYVIPFPLSQVSVIIIPFQYPGTVCSKACLTLHPICPAFIEVTLPLICLWMTSKRMSELACAVAVICSSRSMKHAQSSTCLQCHSIISGPSWQSSLCFSHGGTHTQHADSCLHAALLAFCSRTPHQCSVGTR